MSNFVLRTVGASGATQLVNTNATQFDFSSIRIGADHLAIAQGGSGAGAYLDIGAVALRSSFVAVNAYDLVNKAYADAMSAGLLVKDAVRLMTDTALSAYTAAGSGSGKTLTANANGALTLDGVLAIAGDRVLVTTEGIHSGIYVVTDTGSGATQWVLTRAIDFDGTPTYEVRGGVFTFVQEGTNNSDSGWVLTNNGTVTVDTTSLVFTQFSGAGQITPGTALAKTGNIINALYDNVTIGVNGSNQLFVKSLSIITSLIADSAVTEAKLAASVAGDGLTGGAGSPLAVGAGDGVKASADNIALDYAGSFVNDNASPVTIRTIVYLKSNGNVDIANPTNATYDSKIMITEDASVAAAGSGKFTVRPGRVVTGFTGLVPGKTYYVADNGGIDLYANLALTSGQNYHVVGKALSATSLLFDPQFDSYVV